MIGAESRAESHMERFGHEITPLTRTEEKGVRRIWHREGRDAESGVASLVPGLLAWAAMRKAAANAGH
jgi:hypothetical protein